MSQKALLIITDGDYLEAVRVVPIGGVIKNQKPRVEIKNGMKTITQFIRTDIPLMVQKNGQDSAVVLASGTKSSDMIAAIQLLVAEAKLGK